MMPEIALLSLKSEKCTGCQMCLLACSASREGVFNPRRATLWAERPYTRQGLEVRFHACDGCLTCQDTCPVGAIGVREGHLFLDRALCTECGACAEACPHGVIRVDPIRLCDGCGDSPDGPACVAWCPTGALSLVNGRGVSAGA